MPNNRFRVWDGEKMHYPGEDWTDGAYMLAGDGAIMQYRETLGDDGIESYMAGYDEGDDMYVLFSTDYTCGRDNDQEIYAGDLITNDYLESANGCPIIIYNKESVEQVTGSRSVAQRRDDLRRWRIIGNVYEHPERAEAKDESDDKNTPAHP